MTQPTKPTIDEQIEAAKALGGERGKAILATLERIKAAEAGLPVEPNSVLAMRLVGSDPHAIAYIDSLQSALPEDK